jgi:GTP cyclohydrolase I
VRLTIDPKAREALGRLQEDLLAEGLKDTPQNIASAVLFFITPQQAVGMTMAFNRRQARQGEE